MTTVFSDAQKCAVCGTKNTYSVIGSTNTFGGGPDLDLRPAEMYRSTMRYWIQECSECGYISEKVSDPSGVSVDWLKSEQYKSCNGINFVSDLAEQFYKYYLINIEDNNQEDAFFAVLHAAWACDDKNDDDNAKHCRELAVPLAEKMIDSSYENKDNIRLMKADLLRRTGQFERLENEFSNVSFTEELLNQILDFQLNKAKERDISRYRVEDVTENTQGR